MTEFEVASWDYLLLPGLIATGAVLAYFGWHP